MLVDATEQCTLEAMAVTKQPMDVMENSSESMVVVFDMINERLAKIDETLHGKIKALEDKLDAHVCKKPAKPSKTKPAKRSNGKCSYHIHGNRLEEFCPGWIYIADGYEGTCVCRGGSWDWPGCCVD